MAGMESARGTGVTIESQIDIRRAGLDDRDTVFGLHVDSVTALCSSHYAKAQIDGWFVARSPDNYTRAIEGGALWIAEIDGEPVGFTEFFPGLISMLFVRGASAGQGIGLRLLNFAQSRAQQGGAVVKLEATLNAQAFYEKHGFIKVGDSHLRRASGVQLETVLMERGQAAHKALEEAAPS